VGDPENTTLRFICGQSFAEDGNGKEPTLQMGFFSVIRCHDPCEVELISQSVVKLQII
jgi:hypothetical protein